MIIKKKKTSLAISFLKKKTLQPTRIENFYIGWKIKMSYYITTAIEKRIFFLLIICNVHSNELGNFSLEKIHKPSKQIGIEHFYIGRKRKIGYNTSAITIDRL